MISAIERSTSLLHHANHHHLGHLNGNNSTSSSTGSSSPSPVSNMLTSSTSTAASLLLPSNHHLTSNAGQFAHSHHHHHSSHHHSHLSHPAHLNYSHHHHLSHLHSALSIASTVLNSSNNSSSSSSSGLSVATFGDTGLPLAGASSPSPVSVGGGGGHLDSTPQRASNRKSDTPVSPASGESVTAPARRHSSSPPVSIISPSDGTHSPALSGKTTLDISSSSRSVKSLNSGPGNCSLRDSGLSAGTVCSTGGPSSPLTASSAVGSPASTSTSAERSTCPAPCTIASSVSSGSLSLAVASGNSNSHTGSYSGASSSGHPHSHHHHHGSLDTSAGRLLSSPVSNSAAVAASAYSHAAHPFSGSFYHSPYTADTAAAAAAASASYMFAASSAAASSSLYPTLDSSSGTWGSTVAIGQTGCYSYDTSSLYSPYGDRYSAAAAAAAGMDSAARRKNATRETTNTLKAWLYEHRKNPYPTKGEKIMLAIITKMTLTQVSTWFANARRRLKKENKMTWEPRNKPSEVTDDIDDDKDSISGSTVCDDSNTNGEDASATGTNVTETTGSHQRDSDSNTSTGNKRENCNPRSNSSSSSLLSLKPVESNSSNAMVINETSSHPPTHLLHPHPLHHTQYSPHLHAPSLAHGQSVAHNLPFEPHALSHILSNSSGDKSSLSIGRLTSLTSGPVSASAINGGQHTVALSSSSNCSSSTSSSLHGACNPSVSSPSHLSSLNVHPGLASATGSSANHTLPCHVSIASHLAAQAGVHHPCYTSHAMAAAAHHSAVHSNAAVHPQTSSGHHAHYPASSGHHAHFNASHLTAPQASHLSHPHGHSHHHSLSSLHPMTSTSPSNASSPSTSPSAICTSSSAPVITSSSTSTSSIPGKDVPAVPSANGGPFAYNLRWNHHHHQPTESPAPPFMFM